MEKESFRVQTFIGSTQLQLHITQGLEVIQQMCPKAIQSQCQMGLQTLFIYYQWFYCNFVVVVVCFVLLLHIRSLIHETQTKQICVYIIRRANVIVHVAFMKMFHMFKTFCRYKQHLLLYLCYMACCSQNVQIPLKCGFKTQSNNLEIYDIFLN